MYGDNKAKWRQWGNTEYLLCPDHIAAQGAEEICLTVGKEKWADQCCESCSKALSCDGKDCSGNGKCTNGKCGCNEGYTGDDCERKFFYSHMTLCMELENTVKM